MRSALAVSILLLTCSTALAIDEGSYEVDESKVYHGTADSFSAPATVERDTVFAEISAYKQIEKEGLKDNHPRYWILLQKANDVFKKALEKVAKDGSYDLIAETGSVQGKGKNKKKTPPDITQQAIDAVEELEKEE